MIFSEDGKVIGLRVGWLFDDFYSAFVLEDLEPLLPADKKMQSSPSYNQTLLDQLAASNLKNLEDYHYFTAVRMNGEALPFKPVERFSTTVKERRLWLDFDVMLREPVDPKSGQLEYATYDPSYYIEILHMKEGDPIRFIGDGSIGCHYSLAPPEPSVELTLQMSALDRTQKPAQDGVGALFAEWVQVKCP